MKRYADLHVHTFYSDSTFSPEEAVSCAKSKGLAAIAICDHDTIDGIQPSIAIGEKVGVEIIPGVELTVEKADAEVHILGYFIDWKADWFQKRLKEMQYHRVERVYKIAEKLNDAKVEFNPDDVFKLAPKGTVGRLHIARAMLKKGKIRNIREAFEKYIGFLKPCYVPNVKFSPQEAIGLIRSSGGVPVLAHPNLMNKDEYIQEFVDYGLRGIEVYHTDHSLITRRHYEGIAGRFNLIMTGGSDCHGLGKGRVLMGGVKVPYEVVEELKEEAGRIRDGNG